MITAKTLQQLDKATAETAKDALQADYVTNNLDNTLVAVSMQLDVWGFCGIPIGRLDEFNNGSIEKKTQFNLISVLAASDKDNNYVTAWEAEYAKMFG
jgi:hypothetical protein